MTATEIVSLSVSSLSLASVIYFGGWKLGRLQLKTDTMWTAFLRRAAVEGVGQGLMSINSPIKINEESLRLLEKMRPELEAFYKESNGSKLTDQDLALAIERKFGTKLVTDICIPNNLSVLLCLLIAVAVARGATELNDILKDAETKMIEK